MLTNNLPAAPMPSLVIHLMAAAEAAAPAGPTSKPVRIRTVSEVSSVYKDGCTCTLASDSARPASTGHKQLSRASRHLYVTSDLRESSRVGLTAILSSWLGAERHVPRVQAARAYALRV